ARARADEPEREGDPDRDGIRVRLLHSARALDAPDVHGERLRGAPGRTAGDPLGVLLPSELGLADERGHERAQDDRRDDHPDEHLDERHAAARRAHGPPPVLNGLPCPPVRRVMTIESGATSGFSDVTVTVTRVWPPPIGWTPMQRPWENLACGGRVLHPLCAASAWIGREDRRSASLCRIAFRSTVPLSATCRVAAVNMTGASARRVTLIRTIATSASTRVNPPQRALVPGLTGPRSG